MRTAPNMHQTHISRTLLLAALTMTGCAGIAGVPELHVQASGTPNTGIPDDGATQEETDVPAESDNETDAPPAVNPTVWHVDATADGSSGAGTREHPFTQLQSAIDAAVDEDVIFVHDGTHAADPYDAADPTCGNCDDAEFMSEIPITIGFIIADKTVHIRGESRTGTVLNTGAGYGVLFENAGASSIQNLTVTGGIRDADGRATDGAIVVRQTDLLVADVDINENNDLYQGEPDPVVGISGIVGREGAILTVDGCRILNNSWDGIALYRGQPGVKSSASRANIYSNTIGCTQDCVGGANGRGVGIGVTWDAQATIYNNRIHNYWKGVGSFGTSNVVLLNNVIKDMHGWGVVAAGGSTMYAVNNTIVGNGNVGFAAWNEGTSGSFVNNIVTGNGRVEEWVAKQAGVWLNDNGAFDFAYNDVWNNNGEDVCTGGDPGGAPCTPIAFDGVDGNFSTDPLFDGEGHLQLSSDSPAIDAGHPDILDPDRSRSDLGMFGGPWAVDLP